VDFELSEDEVALAAGIRSLCAGRFPLERLRAAEGGPGLVDAEAWGELGDAGVFALRLPESDGGVGLGLGATSVVFEELGRALVPGPLVASHLAAGVIDGSAEGKVVVGAVHRPAASGVGAMVPRLIAHLPSLGVLVVVADDGLRAVDPRTVDAVPIVRSLDPLTPLWRVDHLPEGQSIGGPDAAGLWRRDEAVLTGALLVGLAAGTLDMAVAYALQREQFGKPIGSFQAVKHMCADMLVRAETARAAVHAAAVTIDQPGVGDAERAAAGAGLLAADAAIANGKTCIQVHGGMGFTWEVPAHLFMMRARVLAESIGPLGGLAERVAELY
jgi:alkylation response protein AidB-like acyl-CoA dehydrogenase